MSNSTMCWSAAAAASLSSHSAGGGAWVAAKWAAHSSSASASLPAAPPPPCCPGAAAEAAKAAKAPGPPNPWRPAPAGSAGSAGASNSSWAAGNLITSWRPSSSAAPPELGLEKATSTSKPSPESPKATPTVPAGTPLPAALTTTLSNARKNPGSGASKSCLYSPPPPPPGERKLLPRLPRLDLLPRRLPRLPLRLLGNWLPRRLALLPRRLPLSDGPSSADAPSTKHDTMKKKRLSSTKARSSILPGACAAPNTVMSCAPSPLESSPIPCPAESDSSTGATAAKPRLSVKAASEAAPRPLDATSLSRRSSKVLRQPSAKSLDSMNPRTSSGSLDMNTFISFLSPARWVSIVRSSVIFSSSKILSSSSSSSSSSSPSPSLSSNSISRSAASSASSSASRSSSSMECFFSTCFLVAESTSSSMPASHATTASSWAVRLAPWPSSALSLADEKKAFPSFPFFSALEALGLRSFLGSWLGSRPLVLKSRSARWSRLPPDFRPSASRPSLRRLIPRAFASLTLCTLQRSTGFLFAGASPEPPALAPAE
mmetsp:Transcript_33600/g.75980  ORF Transcript_33600/g.75980 Transcript_33600/m.75980 type:complete len:544 (-) Transcript_33600:853-2484(-)